jgi:hypothetical protein
MDTNKMWELFKPVMLEWIKNRKAELEKEGYIVTAELLIEDLKK